MKKINYAFISLLFFVTAVSANPIKEQTAQTVATNFYSQNFKLASPTLTLAYTELASDGQPVYYIYDVKNEGGFIIVAAEDAAHPILGYSNKGHYVIPTNNNNVAWWMNCRKKEIVYARTKSISASSDIANEWSAYINNTIPRMHSAMSVVNPLLQSYWNQAPYFNDMCPGGSVTGCVATAMAQIMRYWSYPAHGHGYSAYWEKQADGYFQNYGYLAADYDTSNYAWSAMPYSLSGSNGEIAKLMYDCGVSVDMDYSPSESGAWVITGDYPVCSQNSYVKYFGYNRYTVKGVYKSNYTFANWVSLIENELNNSRPVQYVGNDSVNNAGHTWVCDGYDASNNFDMNWGWGGSDNGYYSPSSINVIGYNFDWWDEAVIGIEPPQVSAYFSGSATFGCAPLSVTYHDSSISLSAITAYKWLCPGGSPSASIAASPAIMYSTPGTYDVTEIVTTSGGVDTVVRKAYISVASSSVAPVVQNFQSGTFPPAGWVINNPYGYSYTWQQSSNVGGYGSSTKCMYFNNSQLIADYLTIYTGLWVTPPSNPAVDVIGQRQQIYSPEYDYTYMLNPVIYFDVAYEPYNTNFSDTLNIYYSTDCGATFHSIYSKGGTVLATTGSMASNGVDTDAKGIFVPSNNHWRTDTIHIPAIAGASSVMFSFENLSGNGGALYIDNINITGKSTLGVPVISSAPSAKVYPNPSTGQFTFQLSDVSVQSSVEIYNVLGEKVYSRPASGETTFNINLSSQPKGVYIYRIFTESGSAISTGRLVVE